MHAVFPRLLPAAAAARLEIAQTIAYALLPLGAALFLRAGGYYTPGGLWALHAILLVAGVMPTVLVFAWRRTLRHPHALASRFSCLQYFFRYYAILLLVSLLLIFLAGIGMGAQGMWAFIFMLLGTAVFPITRVLRGGAAPLHDPLPPQRAVRLAACHVLMFSAYTLAVATFLSGAILRANEAYPTDPTLLVLVFWLIATLLIICSLTLFVNYIGVLYKKQRIHQPLDDPPPPAAAAAAPPRFHTDSF